ncbi:HlyD family efflux transporter periplasmic adaptor subunit [Ferruginibacter lapsinanis]|uniref:efflux RND transporter periplasmic adaptor subunit n=1 Tax=Ferruginibacter lapsinanis TaxID=563172 RepID=UPI001E32ED55|nr:HlyD family efflux transporter periplasmic adaptor subunit [Ferruginibacter lapsinanis]UEG49109.1 HlyD family efflux transporter periplasmic adaptor subunit [Ferruginibacter lapsinanis]
MKLFTSFIALILLVSCKSKQEKTNPIEEKITESVYASGIIKSKNQYQVFSAVGGLVKDILVTEGDLIKKGDAIMRLSDITARLNSENAKIAADYSSVAANADKLNALKIDIANAKAKMENDASLLEKQRNLWNQGIGTRNELDQRELMHTNSVNAYNAAKLRYNDLQQQLNFQSKQSQKRLEISNTTTGDYTIKSEVSGKVYDVLKEKGEMVNTQTPVALIGDANGFIVELQVDEYDIARIKIGQKILLSMDSYKGQVFEAVVEKINPAMNAQTKSFTIDAAFITPPPALYPNLTTEANIIINVKEKALTIPRNYLIDDTYVMLSTKEKRKVTTGLKDYQKIEILSGLTSKDVIIKPL